MNPFSIDEMAEAIHRAIQMPRDESRKRMRRLRSRDGGKYHLSLGRENPDDSVEDRFFRTGGGTERRPAGLPVQPDDEPLLDRLAEVASEIGAASHFLLCLDFDGTLAPIVPDPADARMPGETRAVLDQLVSQPGVTVAVVSGRAAEDLQTRVGLNVILAANHGLEIIEGNTCWRHPTAAGLQPILHEICGELVARASRNSRRAGRGQGPHCELSLSQCGERRRAPDFRNTEYCRCAA